MTKSFIVLFFAGLAIAFTSCKSTEENELVNHWRLAESRSAHRDSIRNVIFNAVENMEANIDSVRDPAEHRIFMQDLNDKRRILYRNDSLLKAQRDSSFLMISVNGLYDCNLLGVKETGTWKFDGDKKELVTKPAGNGKEGRLKVLRINSDSLTLGTDTSNCMIFYSMRARF